MNTRRWAIYKQYEHWHLASGGCHWHCDSFSDAVELFIYFAYRCAQQ
jgi:hypothetical protein